MLPPRLPTAVDTVNGRSVGWPKRKRAPSPISPHIGLRPARGAGSDAPRRVSRAAEARKETASTAMASGAVTSAINQPATPGPTAATVE